MKRFKNPIFLEDPKDLRRGEHDPFFVSFLLGFMSGVLTLTSILYYLGALS